MTAFCNHFIRVDLCDVCSPIKDPRDAEIAHLRAEAGVEQRGRKMAIQRIADLEADLAAHKRALAAGPAALREMGFAGYESAALDVEAAQADAMEEEP